MLHNNITGSKLSVTVIIVFSCNTLILCRSIRIIAISYHDENYFVTKSLPIRSIFTGVGNGISYQLMFGDIAGKVIFIYSWILLITCMHNTITIYNDISYYNNFAPCAFHAQKQPQLRTIYYQCAFKTSSSYILFLFVTRFTDVNVQQYTAINAFKLFVTKKTLKFILYLHSETA